MAGWLAGWWIDNWLTVWGRKKSFLKPSFKLSRQVPIQSWIPLNICFVFVSCVLCWTPVVSTLIAAAPNENWTVSWPTSRWEYQIYIDLNYISKSFFKKDVNHIRYFQVWPQSRFNWQPLGLISRKSESPSDYVFLWSQMYRLMCWKRRPTLCSTRSTHFLKMWITW